MSEANWIMLALALFFGLLSWRNPRGIAWIIAGAISYTVSVIYWRSGLPLPEGVAGTLDALVCVAIYARAREQWELSVIWRLFQTSVAVNFLFLAGNIGVFPRISIDLYSAILEALNVLVLLSIGGWSFAQMAGWSNGLDRSRLSRNPVRRLVSALGNRRSTPPFWAH